MSIFDNPSLIAILARFLLSRMLILRRESRLSTIKVRELILREFERS